jgi:hypothetical protein
LKLTSHKIYETDKESGGSVKQAKYPLVLLVKVGCREGKILGIGIFSTWIDEKCSVLRMLRKEVEELE